IKEWIFLSEMPDGHGDSPAWLEYSQPLSDRIHRRREKHHAKAAYHRIESIAWKGQAAVERHFKAGVAKSQAVSLSTSSLYPLLNRIGSHYLALRSNHLGNAQGWFTRTRGYVEDGAVTGDLCILN